MADNWIKFRKKLLRDGRVIQLSRSCHATRVTVIGALVTLWCLADEYAEESGLLPGYSADDIDREVEVPGFCAALPSDWVQINEDGSVQLPQYQEHNGVTAKRRAQAMSRQKRNRAGRYGNAPVTNPSRSRRDNSVTREEKRREENNTPLPPTGGMGEPSFRINDSLPGNLYASTDFKAAWLRWKAYHGQRGKALTPLTIQSQLQQLSEWGPEVATAAIEHSIRNNWTKLVPPEPTVPKPATLTDDERAAKARADREARRARLGRPAEASELFAPPEGGVR